MTIKLDDELPEVPEFVEGIRRASKRELVLNQEEIKLALKMPYVIFRKNGMKN